NERLKDLCSVFGLQENTDLNQFFSQYNIFIEQLKSIVLLKENLVQLENEEDKIQQILDKIFKENDILFQELVKKQSEEAKTYSQLNENLQKRLIIQKTINYFINTNNINDKNYHNIPQIIQQFQQNFTIYKPLADEQSTILQGLQKTSQTIYTFNNLLESIINENEKRFQLMNQIEECIKLRTDSDKLQIYIYIQNLYFLIIYNSKNEILRNIEMDLVQKNQQKKNLEEDLSEILSEADLEEYKKIGKKLQNLDKQQIKLQNQKIQIQNEIQYAENQVFSKICIVKNQYKNIIQEIVPNDINLYNFNSGNDIKIIRNILKKTFKRLNIQFK
ncbi:hypothetical protein IMG5_138220, partial [Ichthyophthirius multifiliis]